ncbi:hypothetical protein TNCT_689161 [Trichonephila clavata]|uniref:Uncharacterized protein n=1 Tax=Trichonephila clavata TaxID=2740835 RepID=A0A8X6M4C7_TRICU|nr:hypothetical protein TNCT_689161 [Trichonephila clavata]
MKWMQSYGLTARLNSFRRYTNSEGSERAMLQMAFFCRLDKLPANRMRDSSPHSSLPEDPLIPSCSLSFPTSVQEFVSAGDSVNAGGVIFLNFTVMATLQ